MALSTAFSSNRASIRKGSGLQTIISKAIKKIPLGGIVNTVIDKLPYEIHIPNYQFCGPGTKLQKRLARGDVGINKLDEACKEHDILYSKYSDSEKRSIADQQLAQKAWERVRSSDASFGERASALAVAAAMKAKRAISGGSIRRRKRKNKNKKKGGNIKRRRNVNKKKSNKKQNLWSMIRSGKGLYLKPYRRVY